MYIVKLVIYSIYINYLQVCLLKYVKKHTHFINDNLDIGLTLYSGIAHVAGILLNFKIWLNIPRKIEFVNYPFVFGLSFIPVDSTYKIRPVCLSVLFLSAVSQDVSNGMWRRWQPPSHVGGNCQISRVFWLDATWILIWSGIVSSGSDTTGQIDE